MSLRHAALGLLATCGPASGYDLLQIFQRSLANVWPATQSQLYTELGRLADAGLVTATSQGRRGRKEYTLTDEGRAELRHWMTEVAPAVSRRSDMLLRVFFLEVLTPEQAERYLRARASDAAEYHEALRAVSDRVSNETGPLADHGRLALEWGLRYTAMVKEWAEWAAEQVGPTPH